MNIFIQKLDEISQMDEKENAGRFLLVPNLSPRLGKLEKYEK